MALPPDRLALAALLHAAREPISTAVIETDLRRRPELAARYGANLAEAYRRDNDHHVRFLGEAIAAGQPSLFADYISWAKAMLRSYGVRTEDLLTNLRVLREAIHDVLPHNHRATIDAYIDAGVTMVISESADEPPAFIQPERPHAVVAADYLEALLNGKRALAASLIADASQTGVGVREIYLHIFQPAMREVGRLWQMNRISVAQEHFCTAATQLIMSQLYPRLLETPKCGRSLVATCVAGDLHELGMRIVSDLFEADGWDSYYLGANTPARDIARLVVDKQPDVLAISATMSFHVTAVAELITLVRSHGQTQQITILVGGRPFSIAADLWREVGADGTAAGALEALDAARRLLRNRQNT